MLPSPSAAAALAVDHRGRPASYSSTGGWRSALLIIAVEIAERFAFYGVQANLITYLTGPLKEPTAKAAAQVNAWAGAASLLPIAGAAVADSLLGRYRTIAASAALYVAGLGMLALATIVNRCSVASPCLPSSSHVFFFYASLYLVAIAQGGVKPCLEAFGADQFDAADPKESVSRSSFFNWWYFGICFGTTVTLLVLSYIQDNISWGLGFGIPCAVMLVALTIFLSGTRMYRYFVLSKSETVCSRVSRVVTAFQRHWRTSVDDSATEEERNKDEMIVEDVKGVLRLSPIWATCLIYAIVFSQSSTFFTKSAATLDRHIGSDFQVPPAALQSFISITIVIFIPIYDRLFVPLARRITGLPSGITMLQRIGIGIVLSIVSMVVAALVEVKRLQTAKDSGLIDNPKVPLPMSLWWMIPQYVIFGIADVFTIVGLQEFFYDQMPSSLRSLGLAFYLSIFGVGSLLSSLLVSIIDNATRHGGNQGSWFTNNLNRAHLDYFYWLLAVLSAVGLLLYLLCAKLYKYKKHHQPTRTNAVSAEI